jgi:hypothetical protein
MCLVVESAKLGNNDGRETFGTLEPTCYADIRAHVDDDACVGADAACSLIRRAGRSVITAYIRFLDIGGCQQPKFLLRRVSVTPAGFRYIQKLASLFPPFCRSSELGL